MLFLVLAGLIASSHDIHGDELFDRCKSAMQRLQTIEAEVTTTGVGRFSKLGFHGSMKLQKPNAGKIFLEDVEIPTLIRRVSDGSLLAVKLDENQVQLEQASADGDNLVGTTHCSEALYFFEPAELEVLRSTGTGFKIDGFALIGGVRCKVLRVIGTPSGITNRLYIGPEDIVYGTDNITERNGVELGFQSRLTHVRVNSKFRPSEFKIESMFGGSVYTFGTPGPALREIRRLPKGLRDGDTLPKLRFKDLDGHKLDVFAFVHSHKVTLINFWSVFCAPCRLELGEFGDKLPNWNNLGVGVIAVDSMDTLDSAGKFWAERKFPFRPYLTDGTTASSLGIVGLPTTFVVDKHGRVVTSILGVSMAELQSAIDRTLAKN